MPSLILLLLFFKLCLADILFTSPSPGSVQANGAPLSISWVESGLSPLISELSSYQIFLCAGGNDPSGIIQLVTVSIGNFPSSGIITQVSPAIGASEPPNA
jgi:hypothetical protein